MGGRGRAAARGLGVLVVMNGEIHAACHVRKARPANPVARHFVSVPRDAASAPVALLTAALGDDDRLIACALDTGYKGWWSRPRGGGYVAGWFADTLSDAAERVPVILASRTGAGETLRRTYDFKDSETDLLAAALRLRAGSTTSRRVREAFTAWLDPHSVR